MKYFQFFPKVYYDAYGTSPPTLDIVTKITSRFKFRDAILNNSMVYYEYNVQDSDSPEIIAHKYYGDPNRHWVILLTNKIINPWYDWPLDSERFNNFILAKYGSLANATNTVDHYEKTISKTDSATGITTDFTYNIDLATYTALPLTSETTVNLSDGSVVSILTTKSVVSAYEAEVTKNESRRLIKIIDKLYIPQIEVELRNLYTNG